MQDVDAEVSRIMAAASDDSVAPNSVDKIREQLRLTQLRARRAELVAGLTEHEWQAAARQLVVSADRTSCALLAAFTAWDDLSVELLTEIATAKVSTNHSLKALQASIKSFAERARDVLDKQQPSITAAQVSSSVCACVRAACVCA